MRLFDVANGQALGALPSPSGSTAVPMFLPGDAGLVAGQEDGTATLWDLRPAALARRACEIAGRRLTHAEWDAGTLPGSCLRAGVLRRRPDRSPRCPANATI